MERTTEAVVWFYRGLIFGLAFLGAISLMLVVLGLVAQTAGSLSLDTGIIPWAYRPRLHVVLNDSYFWFDVYF